MRKLGGREVERNVLFFNQRVKLGNQVSKNANCANKARKGAK